MLELAAAIYFIAFQSKFKDQFVPKMQESLRNTYEGPLALLFNDPQKPSPLSLAWDFIMYNVRGRPCSHLSFVRTRVAFF